MMMENLDVLLFDRFRFMGRHMRAGHAPGVMNSDDSSKPGSPAFQREFILAILHRSEGSMRQKDIAEDIRVSPSTLSEMLNKLETDGYVVRNTDPFDRRATLLSLTEKGEARAQDIEAERVKFFARLFKNLTDDEKLQLITLLDKLVGYEEDNE